MAKIDPGLTTASAPRKAVQESLKSVEQASTPPTAGDRLAVSGVVKTAERLRAFNRDVEALFEFKPRTTAQAVAWLDQGRTLHDVGAPSLKNGDLKALPLKERQQVAINLHRLERFLEDGPSLLRAFTGE